MSARNLIVGAKPKGHERLCGRVQSGQSRAFVVDKVSIENVLPIIEENVARETYIMTDEAPLYRKQFTDYLEHAVVNHARGEYVRGPIHTNTIEGYFSIFKRGIRGVYQWCAEKHLHRYVVEFIISGVINRVYETEEKYRAAVRRDNEMVKTISTVLANLGTLLMGAAAARWFYTSADWIDGLWFLGAFGLIFVGILVLNALQGER